MQKKEFHHLKSLQCKRLLKDEQGHLIPTSEQCFTILYNETKVSFDNLRQMILDDSYKNAKDILVVNEEIATQLSDAILDMT